MEVGATTETAVASYNLSFSVENGNLQSVHANVTTKGENPVRGIVRYRVGAYEVGAFPYGEKELAEVMADFKTVVDAVKSSIE